MATDQLFSQLLPQNQEAGTYPDKLRPSDSAHPAKLKTNRESNKAEGESFLSTLKRVSQRADRTKKSASIDLVNKAETKAPVLEDKMDDTSEATDVQNEQMSSTAMEAAIERLQQFIAEILEGKSPTLTDGNSGNSQFIDMTQNSGRIFQWLKELVGDLHDQKNYRGTGEGATGPIGNPSDSTLTDGRGILKPAADSMDLIANSKAGVPGQPAEPEAGSPSNAFSHTTAVEEPVSRVAQEIQDLKDGHVRVPDGMKEETGGKATKTEIGTNDTGLLNSQNPLQEKSTESLSMSKELDFDRNGLKTQTLDQIVHRAAIHLKNGQHEARIDLKPEYLGHIRLQVTSENHQVTVKILAEHGFVKDMIENNAHQLKADLQQQGLHIDKLEVTVSRDSDDSGYSKERFAGMKARQGAADHGKQGNSGQDPTRNKRQWRRLPGGATMVDYFA